MEINDFDWSFFLKKLMCPNFQNVKFFNHLKFYLKGKDLNKITIQSNSEIYIFYSLEPISERYSPYKINCLEIPELDSIEINLQTVEGEQYYGVGFFLEIIPFTNSYLNNLEITFSIPRHVAASYLDCSKYYIKNKKSNQILVDSRKTFSENCFKEEKSIKVKSNNFKNSGEKLFSFGASENIKSLGKDLKTEIQENQYINMSITKFKTNIIELTQNINNSINEIKEIDQNSDLEEYFRQVHHHLDNIEEQNDSITEKVEKLYLGQQEILESIEENREMLGEILEFQTLPELINIREANDEDKNLIKERTSIVKQIKHIFKKKIIFEFKCGNPNCIRQNRFKFALFQESKIEKVLKIAVKFIPIAKKINEMIESEEFDTKMGDNIIETVRELSNIETDEEIRGHNIELSFRPDEIEMFYREMLCIEQEAPKSLIDVFKFSHQKHICYRCYKEKTYEKLKEIKPNIKIPQYEIDALKDIEDLVDLEVFGDLNNGNERKSYAIVEEESVRKLDLSNNQLSTLPESIGNLTSLEKLILDYNSITTLPKSIGKLTSLEELWVRNNQLSTLPKSIGKLTSLKKLSLHNNKLKTLPKSIGNLTSLEELYLDWNNLSTLPDSIGDLSSLQTLSVVSNQLSPLPTLFGLLEERRVEILRKIP